MCKGLCVAKPVFLIDQLKKIHQKMLDDSSVQSFVSVQDFEKEESFLKYLLGWNNTIASHMSSLLKNPQRVNEDD